MKEDNYIEGIEGLNQEMKKVTTLCEFLIVQPNLLISMIEPERERIMVQNLLRVKCCNFWAEKMVKEVESKCSKESVKVINKIFGMVKVNKSNRKI